MNSLSETLHAEDFTEESLASDKSKLSVKDALECDGKNGCTYEVADQLHCSPNSKVYLVNMRTSPTSAVSSKEAEVVQSAIKLVNGGLFTYLLDREYRILNTLNHPNIIKPLRYQYSCNSEGKASSVLAVPYYKRGDLFEAVKSKDGLGETKSLKYFKQIASALEYVHEANIAHRDIKLENMVIDDDSNAKLIDFGFAYTSEIGSEKDIQSQIFEECAESQVEGTMGYMAPELLQACHENNQANSVFSEK
jgi:serine/threonine protein kinase